MKKISLLTIICLVFYSCTEEAEIQVRNDIHNVKMVDISWGNYSIVTYLMPGESSEKIEIRENERDFPMSHRIKFYLTADGNTVFLETQQYYELDKNDLLRIVISDTTEVINHMLE